MVVPQASQGDCARPTGGVFSQAWAENEYCIGFFLKNLLLNFLSRPDFIAYNLEDVHRACSFRLCSYLYRVQKVLWVVRSPEQAAIARKQNAVMIFEGFDPREG